jgi:hypothetical protein
MEAYWGVEVYLHSFFDLGTRWGEWSASHSGRFTTKERAPGTHWIEGWVGPRTVLDAPSMETEVLLSWSQQLALDSALSQSYLHHTFIFRSF